MNKFKLTDKFKIVDNRKVYRICALKDFNDVRAGDLGGFVESEDNLSHIGNCWIYDDAIAINESRVFGDACMYNRSKALDNTSIFGHAIIEGDAVLRDNAEACDYTHIRDYAEVKDNVRAYGQSRIDGHAKVGGNLKVNEGARIGCNAVATKYLTFLSTSKYNVTITDNYMKIGCKTLTIEEWFKLTYKEINRMDKGALRWWKKYKLVLKTLIKVRY